MLYDNVLTSFSLPIVESCFLESGLKEIYRLSSQKFNEVDHNLNFILSHFQEPIFPRNIMTKALGCQKEVFDMQKVLEYFRVSNYENCRINAYLSFTRYHGINSTVPCFLMINIDLKDLV